jgi:hypothetical protein
MDEPIVNGFRVLGAELKRRLAAPMPHVTFWAYLLVGVIGFGGLAVWGELGIYIAGLVKGGASVDHLKVAMVTFFPALIGSVAVQLVFEEAGRDKRMMAFAITMGGIFCVLGLILTFDPDLADWFAMLLATLSCVASVFVWWIANGFNPAFTDKLNLDAPLGGPVTQAPSGSLTNFKT